MLRHSLSQAEIVEALTGQDADQRKAALQCLFEHPALRQSAIAHVRKYGGNRQDAEDVFQEAIILFDRKLRQGAFLGQGSLEAYFMGIVRWHWFNEQKRSGQTTLAFQKNAPEPSPHENPEIEYLMTERRDQLEHLLKQLTEKCSRILKMYQLDYSMDEIANALGFANSGVAKKEAFLCRKRFRAILNMHPEIWQDLINKNRYEP